MNYPFLSKRSQVYSQLSMEILRNHITSSDRVLDVGSGPGFVAQRIHEELGAEVQCLDVVDLNKTNFTMTLFDGENVPFENNHFSVSLSLYMLHHARESAHLRLLSEMKRVTSSKSLSVRTLHTIGSIAACKNFAKSNQRLISNRTSSPSGHRPTGTNCSSTSAWKYRMSSTYRKKLPGGIRFGVAILF